MKIEDLKTKKPTIFLIAGKVKHGKSTLGTYIKEICDNHGKKTVILQFSTYIKLYAKEYFGWDGKEETKPRELLQQLGTDIIREKLNKSSFHIDRTCEDIEILSFFYDVMIITDVRTPEEIEILKKKFKKVVSIKVTRPECIDKLTEVQKNHYTEVALDGYDKYDYKIENTTLEKLKMAANYIVEEGENES